jgi:uncharacterized protein YecE (DUF72 family)
MGVHFNNYYSGTSGLLLPVPNKLHYPEEFQKKSRLCYYSSLMNTIEVNSSFYKIPQGSTVQRWAQEVRQEFQFTFKLFREITHQKDLVFDPAVVAKFFEVIGMVGEKKGCVLVQLPPSIRIGHLPQLKFLMTVLRDCDLLMEWKIALEFRHPSLYRDEIYELLETYQFGMVVHDKNPASSPVIESHPGFMYLRFHGPDGNYRGSYSEAVLYEYASYILEWLSEGKQVFTYFNNTMGDAYGNLNQLRQLIQDNGKLNF